MLASYIWWSWPALTVIVGIISLKVMTDIFVDHSLVFSYYLKESTDSHYNYRNDLPVSTASVLYGFTSKTAEDYYNGYLDESLFSEVFINLLRLHVTLSENLARFPHDTVKAAQELNKLYNSPEFTHSAFSPNSTNALITQELQGSFDSVSHCAQFRFSRTDDLSEESEIFYYDACKSESASEDAIDIIYIFPTTNTHSSFLAGKSAQLSDTAAITAAILGSDWVTIMLWP